MLLAHDISFLIEILFTDKIIGDIYKILTHFNMVARALEEFSRHVDSYVKGHVWDSFADRKVYVVY